MMLSDEKDDDLLLMMMLDLFHFLLLLLLLLLPLLMMEVQLDNLHTFLSLSVWAVGFSLFSSSLTLLLVLERE